MVRKINIVPHDPYWSKLIEEKKILLIEKFDQYNADMIALGYQPRGEYGIPGRRYFSKGKHEKRTHHVQVFEIGSPEIRKHLDLPDYLREHPSEARLMNN